MLSVGRNIDHLVLRRSMDSGNSTDDSTDPTPDPRIVKLIEILAGSLVAALVLALGLAIVVIILVVRGVRLRQRRREQRDVVLRMKHDIFEGVSNAIVTSEGAGDGDVPVHNVIDSSPERTVECSNEDSTTPVIES